MKTDTKWGKQKPPVDASKECRKYQESFEKVYGIGLIGIYTLPDGTQASVIKHVQYHHEVT